MQPIETVDGVKRFKKNAIVDYLASGQLNKLAAMGFSREDFAQLSQLTGYSVSGWCGLSYVDPDEAAVAHALSQGAPDENQARIAHLESELAALRKATGEAIAGLRELLPEDIG
jgi:hypothetical protein